MFIGFNLTCFKALAVFYIRAFQVKANSREIRMNVKMSVVVLTNLLCWVPLALICLFVPSLFGPEFYSLTMGLILPTNYCFYPFLNTLVIFSLGRQKREKERYLTLHKNSKRIYFKTHTCFHTDSYTAQFNSLLQNIMQTDYIMIKFNLI